LTTLVQDINDRYCLTRVLSVGRSQRKSLIGTVGRGF
jgi:hypothetical protein